ncbi:hypothetical protein SPHINGO391_440172 [Sphingomonas aurantiaca]|uniref:Uncharacterized protein n=1 Tax=Sphingomonas aurantiaca TaxID=185949 RepID=A0A5E7Z5H4_9SPHN|nr:hypothetical protein SPHINGO391_440172 [Sphingomonas aurantiaca]
MIDTPALALRTLPADAAISGSEINDIPRLPEGAAAGTFGARRPQGRTAHLQGRGFQRQPGAYL